MPDSRKPLIIVPIQDRRQHRRILTIRNCAITMLSMAIIFASISMYSARGQKTAGEYGRLFGTQAGTPNHELARKVTVVEEGSVADQASADPMLVAPAVREQLLRAPSNVVSATTSSTSSNLTPAPAVVAPSRGTAEPHGTTIVGDGSGVVVAHAPSSSTAPAPVLSGGIFKQH